jgi:hypothetical protein
METATFAKINKRDRGVQALGGGGTLPGRGNCVGHNTLVTENPRLRGPARISWGTQIGPGHSYPGPICAGLRRAASTSAPRLPDAVMR